MNKLKGTNDFYLEKSKLFTEIVNVSYKIASFRGFQRIITPTIELTETFNRSVGETSDVVNKEMYTFLDRGNRSVTLRPEGTAGVVRAFIENKIYTNNLNFNKFSYDGSMFRYERPQQGRYREFHQFGIESFGERTPLRIFEVIETVVTILKTLDIDAKLKINSIGDLDSRTKYKEELLNYFSKKTDELCDDCKVRLIKNPLRVLDCKICSKLSWFKSAPKITDFLSETSKTHFNEILQLLDNVQIKYALDTNLVRGLDYYTDVVFEIVNNENLALLGGGEFDHLVKMMGGPDIGGAGFAFGIERILEEKLKLNSEAFSYTDVYLLSLDEKSRIKAFDILNVLRNNNIKAEMNYSSFEMKKQFKESEKLSAKYLIIIGEEECRENTFTLKSVNEKTQEKLNLEKLIERLKEEINANTH